MDTEVRKQNEENIKKITDEVNEAINLNSVEDLIKKNEIEFSLNDKFYKVIKPTTAQKSEAYRKKVTKYMQLLQEKDENGNFIYFPEKKLKEIYKTRGIDIDSIDSKINNLNEELEKTQKKLGKLLTETTDEKPLSVLKDEIIKINKQILDSTLYKSSLLEYSLENQSTGYFYEYLAFLMTQIKNDAGEYERAFKNFEEFKSSDSTLTNNVAVYVGLLLGSL